MESASLSARRLTVSLTELGVALDKCSVNTRLEETVLKELQRVWVGERVNAAEEALERKRKQAAQSGLNPARDPNEQTRTSKSRSTGFECNCSLLTK